VNGFTDFQQNSDQIRQSDSLISTAVLHGRAHPRIQTVKSGSREAELSGTAVQPAVLYSCRSRNGVYYTVNYIM
jgi:hypothetical protein